MADENTTLASMNMSTEEFEQALITEAQNRKQKERLERSVRIEQDVLTIIDYCDKQVSYFKMHKERQEARLSALNKGEFTFSPHGDLIYNDVKLNMF